jgi:CheY-like chemotaxis protein
VITKRLLEVMNGTISVESEYEKGSTFTVRFKQQFVTDTPIGKTVVANLKQFRYTVRKRDRNTKLIHLYIPYARVLVVDDVQSNLDIARGMLKPYGLTVDCVTSGFEAIEVMREAKVTYNAIFMDHMMPEMDGIETARIIRNDIGTEYAKTVPIIMLTANALIGNEEMFLKEGFQAFLSKPIDIMRLYAVVNTWVRDKKQEEQLGITGDEYKDTTGESDFDISAVSIDGVDLQQVMVRFGGFDNYIETLASFAANTPLLLETLHNPTAETLAAYAITVHGIKGAGYGICAEQVGREAEALEHAAKAGDLKFVLEQTKSFISSTTQFIAGAARFLETIKPKNTKPVKNTPDTALLAAMRTAAENYDMDAMDKIIAELEQFTYEENDDLVQWLHEQINNSEFDRIIKKLS